MIIPTPIHHGMQLNSNFIIDQIEKVAGSKILISALFLFSEHENRESGNYVQRLSFRHERFRPDVSKNIDRVSVQLLKMTDPKLLESFLPYL